MAFMSMEIAMLYMASLGLTAFMGITFVEYVEKKLPKKIDNIGPWLRKENHGGVQRNSHDYNCSCLGYKLKNTCRHSQRH